jgi:hypothetical protein
MCDCDGNYQLCGGSVDRKARKSHKCCECGRVIAKGESYVEHTGLWRDSGWDSFKWCGHCSAAQKIVEDLTNESCYCFGELWNDVLDEMSGWGGICDMAVYRLVLAARRQWTYRRGPRKGALVPVPKVPAIAGEDLR